VPCWTGVGLAFSAFLSAPKPLILGWAVRTARSLKGVELSALPTSGHLCDERPVSRPASYKVGIPPSPITGRAEGSRFVLGSILLYRVNVERAAAHLPRLRVFPTGLADSTHRANFINLQHTSSCVRDFAPSLSTTSPSVARDLERQCALVNPWGFQSVWLGSTRVPNVRTVAFSPHSFLPGVLPLIASIYGPMPRFMPQCKPSLSSSTILRNLKD
jgi:hypothetical protein